MIRERVRDMNDYDPERYLANASSSTGMSPFLMGAITGAAVALLFAPRPGRDTRHWLKEKADHLRHRGEQELDKLEREDRESTGSYTSPSTSRSTTSPTSTSPTGTARL
jgi:gas vesicle protein